MGRGGSDGGRDTGLERYSSEVESKLQRFQKRHFSRNLARRARLPAPDAAGIQRRAAPDFAPSPGLSVLRLPRCSRRAPKSSAPDPARSECWHCVPVAMCIFFESFFSSRVSWSGARALFSGGVAPLPPARQPSPHFKGFLPFHY